MSSIYEDGGGYSNPGTTGAQTNAGDSKQKIVDRFTWVILAITGVVSGTLSAWGAHAMFPGGWAIPVAFATVVQLCIIMTLWTLPQSGVKRGTLLLVAWFIAVNFAVGSGYYATYQHNSQEVTASLVDKVRASFGAIKKHIQTVEANSDAAENRLQSEIDHGTFNHKREPGDGRKAQELRQTAVALQTPAKQAREADRKVDEALVRLNGADLSVEQIRTLYSSTLSQIGTYADGMQPVTFEDDKRSFITILFAAAEVISGQAKSVDPVERKRILGSWGSASIMELLGLISSLIRMELYRVPRSHNPRGGGRGGGLLERVMSLAHLRKAFQDSWHASKVLSRDATVARVEIWRKRDSDLNEALKGEAPERIWGDMLAVYTQGRSYRRLILELLPNYAGLRGGTSKNAPGPAVAGGAASAVFDARVFEGKPVVIQCAVATQAVRHVDGRLVPGPRWDAFVRFLVGALANPPLRKPARAAGGRPRLRVVGR